jgi:hypothetical protein
MFRHSPVAGLPVPERLPCVVVAVPRQQLQAWLLPVVAPKREDGAEQGDGGRYYPTRYLSLLTCLRYLAPSRHIIKLSAHPLIDGIAVIGQAPYLRRVVFESV